MNSYKEMKLHPEVEAMLLCARADRTEAEQNRLKDLVSRDDADWDRFWSEAAVHEVLPLVARELTAMPFAPLLPAAAVQQAKLVRLQTTAYNLSVHSELVNIAQALHAAGIPAVPLKGTHLAQRLFGAIHARRVGDIDVLVPEQQLQLARSVLCARGYKPAANVSLGIEEHTFHGVPFVRAIESATFVVELHWGLNDPRFVTIDYPYLWQRILATSSSEESLRPLPAEELLIFLSIHLHKHDDGVLRLLADLDRLLRREGSAIDWESVLRVAARWNASSLLYFALQWVQFFFATPVPPAVMRQLLPSRWRQAMVNALAGPQFIIRPTASEHLRSNRSRLAYCAMLTPFRRFLDAYFHYLFTPFTFRRGNTLQTIAARVEGIARGVGWTALIAADCAVPAWRGSRVNVSGSSSALRPH